MCGFGSVGVVTGVFSESDGGGIEMRVVGAGGGTNTAPASVSGEASCTGVDIGAGVDSPPFAELDDGRDGIVVGSGVAVAVAGSPGVDTEGVPLFPPRPATSIAAEFLITFAVGRVPRGAIPATAPARSNPASAKLGRGGGRAGSTHLSNMVFALSFSAACLGSSSAEAGGADPKGDWYRERVPRGFGFGVLDIFEASPCDWPSRFDVLATANPRQLEIR